MGSSAWFIASLGLMLGLLPCLWVLLRAPLSDALVAGQLASTLGTLALLALAQGIGNSSFYDVALTLAVLSIPGGLLVAHMFERWL